MDLAEALPVAECVHYSLPAIRGCFQHRAGCSLCCVGLVVLRLREPCWIGPNILESPGGPDPRDCVHRKAGSGAPPAPHASVWGFSPRSVVPVFDQLDVVSYEEVMRLPAFKRKTLVLIGTSVHFLCWDAAFAMEGGGCSAGAVMPLEPFRTVMAIHSHSSRLCGMALMARMSRTPTHTHLAILNDAYSNCGGHTVLDPPFLPPIYLLLGPGASGVGRSHIKNSLLSDNPEKFGYPVPCKCASLSSCGASLGVVKPWSCCGKEANLRL